MEAATCGGMAGMVGETAAGCDVVAVSLACGALEAADDWAGAVAGDESLGACGWISAGAWTICTGWGWLVAHQSPAAISKATAAALQAMR